ncbi:MAG: GNAT family N-acetyltransferase, partial [Actinomycetota bacterium]
MYANCWCTWWRLSSKDWDAAGAGGRRALFEELVREGREPGLVAYIDDEPVGWVAVGPRDEFPRQQRSPVLAPPDDSTGVWTVNCFWIRKDRRGEGVAQALLRAATDHAFARGATAVDGVPIDPAARAKAADAYTGVVAMFDSEGYVEMARRKPNGRVIMRRRRDRAMP